MSENHNDIYLENLKRLEPNLGMIWGNHPDSSQATAQISIAMSMKRIANSLDRSAEPCLKADVAAIINRENGDMPTAPRGMRVVNALLKAGLKVHW